MQLKNGKIRLSLSLSPAQLVFEIAHNYSTPQWHVFSETFSLFTFLHLCAWKYCYRSKKISFVLNVFISFTIRCNLRRDGSGSWLENEKREMNFHKLILGWTSNEKYMNLSALFHLSQWLTKFELRLKLNFWLAILAGRPHVLWKFLVSFSKASNFVSGLINPLMHTTYPGYIKFALK